MFKKTSPKKPMIKRSAGDKNRSTSIKRKIQTILSNARTPLNGSLNLLSSIPKRQKTSPFLTNGSYLLYKSPLQQQLLSRQNRQSLNDTKLGIYNPRYSTRYTSPFILDDDMNKMNNQPQIKIVQSKNLDSQKFEQIIDQNLKRTIVNQIVPQIELSVFSPNNEESSEQKRLRRQKAFSHFPTSNKIPLKELQGIVTERNEKNNIKNQNEFNRLREFSQEQKEPIFIQTIKNEIDDLFKEDHQMLKQLIQNCNRRMELQKEIDQHFKNKDINNPEEESFDPIKIEIETKRTEQTQRNTYRKKPFLNSGLKNITRGRFSLIHADKENICHNQHKKK